MTQYLFTVKNDAEGKALISNLRKQFRNTPRGIRTRGRGIRRSQFYRDLPIGLSERLAVYLYEKPKTKQVEVVDLSAVGGSRWVIQPTKYYSHRR